MKLYLVEQLSENEGWAESHSYRLDVYNNPMIFSSKEKAELKTKELNAFYDNIEVTFSSQCMYTSTEAAKEFESWKVMPAYRCTEISTFDNVDDLPF
jgi:hypothetical protein